MEIEVNDYVRTETGNITKVIKVKDTVIWTDDFIDGHGRYNEGVIEKKDIVKHSKNIIDLIECGDIILYESNYLGRKVKLEIDYACKKEEDYKWGEGFCSTCIDDRIFIEDIKSILTKEQFSSLEYII